MMICKEYKTKLYKKGSFYIEIRIFQDGVIEVWLQHEGYSLSQLLFGTDRLSYDDVLRYVEYDLDSYIETYTKTVIEGGM